MLFSRIIILFLTSLLYVNASSNIIVIVSKNSSLKNISKKQISKIFLSKTKVLPNNSRALVVEMIDKDIQKLFYKNVSGKNQKQLKKYWATMIFTGRGMPPKKLKSTKDIIQFVQNNDNAISYIKKDKIDLNKIKILMEI